MTDSTLYDAQGNITGFARKAYVPDSWNGAVAGRGNMWGLIAAAALTEAFPSFDAFVAASAPVIQREHRAAMARGELAGQSLIELTAIGWSEHEDRARAFGLTSRPDLSDAGPAYVWTDVCDGEAAGYVLGPKLPEAELWSLHRQGAEPDADYDEDTFDAVRHGIPLMEAQRRTKSDRALGLEFERHVVGGHVYVTTLDRDGVDQRVVHTWGDQAGELIRPAKAAIDRLPLIVPSFIPHDRPDAARRWLSEWKAGLIDPQTLLSRKMIARAA